MSIWCNKLYFIVIYLHIFLYILIILIQYFSLSNQCFSRASRVIFQCIAEECMSQASVRESLLWSVKVLWTKQLCWGQAPAKFLIFVIDKTNLRLNISYNISGHMQLFSCKYWNFCNSNIYERFSSNKEWIQDILWMIQNRFQMTPDTEQHFFTLC